MPDIDAAFARLNAHVEDTIRTPETGAIVAAGRRRRAIRMGAAGLAAVAALGTAGLALAHPRADGHAPVALSPSAAPAPPSESPSEAPSQSPTADPATSPTSEPPGRLPTTIPAGFLLLDAEATHNPGALEGRNDTPGSWPPTLCMGQHPDVPPLPTAERMLAFADRTRPVRIESLDVFGDIAAARTAFANLRTGIRQCPATEHEAGLNTTRTEQPITLGDDAILLKYVTPGGEPTRWQVFVRRGGAIAGYYGPDRAKVLKDAKAMLAKMCRYAGTC